MRLLVAGLCFFVCAGTAAAQTAPATQPQALDRVYACASVADEHERLACYDAAVGRLREAQTSGNLIAVDRVQAQQISREAFGFSLPSLPRLFNFGPGEEFSEVASTIASIEHRGDGKAVFTLANGQVWSQIDTGANGRARPGGEVHVRRATLGSFMLSVEAGGRAIRVRRQE